MNSIRCHTDDCCLDKIFPGQDRDKFECADSCFFSSCSEEFIDHYRKTYPEEIKKFTIFVENLDLEKEGIEPAISPYIKAERKGKIVETFKAYIIKWKCNKGHTNFQTVLDKDKSAIDTCLKCGAHYEYQIKNY